MWWSNVLEMDGSVAAHVNNKLVIFLVNIEKDTVPCWQVRSYDVGEREIQSSTPLYFNLHLMMTTNFIGSNYPEAFIS